MVEGHLLVLTKHKRSVMRVFPLTYRRYLCRCMCLLILAMLTCIYYPASIAQAQEVNEKQIKAVFLYNLAHFVSWPNGIVENGGSFDVGVYGDGLFRRVLDKTVEKEKKEGKQFVVGNIVTVEDITEKCRIIFITGKAAENWNTIRKRIDGLPILTVSDQRGFTSQGGMVSLIREGKKIKIEVNYTTVQQAGLRMSAKLLSLAHIVE